MDKDIFRWFAEVLYFEALKIEDKLDHDFKRYFISTLNLECLGYVDGVLVVRATSYDSAEDALIKLYQQTKDYHS